MQPTDIELKFYKAFKEIKPIDIAKYGSTYVPDSIEIENRKYPAITCARLIRLICVVLNEVQAFEVQRVMTPESLKQKILELCILMQDDIYNQVYEIFKHGYC